jgi:hypothetical protein
VKLLIKQCHGAGRDEEEEEEEEEALHARP